MVDSASIVYSGYTLYIAFSLESIGEVNTQCGNDVASAIQLQLR